MNAELLGVAPPSGEFPEYHFGEHFDSWLWVKFMSNEGEEWVGCFAKGNDGVKSHVAYNSAGSRVFVAAGGNGYLLDTLERKLILQTEEYPLIQSCIATQNPNYFIASTYFSFYVIREDDSLLEIRPEFMVDGIRIKEQVGNKVIGEVETAENQYEKPVPFEFDLITFQTELKHPRTFWSFLK